MIKLLTQNNQILNKQIEDLASIKNVILGILINDNSVNVKNVMITKSKKWDLTVDLLENRELMEETKCLIY